MKDFLSATKESYIMQTFAVDFPIDRSFPISREDLPFFEKPITLLRKILFELIFIFGRQDMFLKYKTVKRLYYKSAGYKNNIEFTGRNTFERMVAEFFSVQLICSFASVGPQRHLYSFAYSLFFSRLNFVCA